MKVNQKLNLLPQPEVKEIEKPSSLFQYGQIHKTLTCPCSYLGYTQ